MVETDTYREEMRGEESRTWKRTKTRTQRDDREEHGQGRSHGHGHREMIGENTGKDALTDTDTER